MNSRPKRKTIPKCQTKYSCKSNVSSFKCKTCNLYFCESCQMRHENHNIKAIITEPSEFCTGKCEEFVKTKPNVLCEICNKKYCFDCFKNEDNLHYKMNKYTNLLTETENEFETLSLDKLPVCANLFSEQEDFQFETIEELAKCLDLELDEEIMVVSIIGRTGEGKSHLLNQTFFKGHEVFETDPGQKRCTVGAFAACTIKKSDIGNDGDRERDENLRLLLIDTEGLHGQTDNAKRRQRLLMKIMAVSDLVLYRTRDSRLGQDVLKCIADAWSAFDRHFLPQLKVKAKLANCEAISLAPGFLLVHTVEHTRPYESENEIIAALKKERPDQSLHMSQLFYVPYHCQPSLNQAIDYKDLHSQILNRLSRLTNRQARPARIVLQSMQNINATFNSNLNSESSANDSAAFIKDSVFPDEFFRCTHQCQACNERCLLPMNHSESKRHRNSKMSCVLSQKLQNFIYLCKKCSSGLNSTGSKQSEVKPLIPKPLSSQEDILTGTVSYLWRGFILECDVCGVIYRSREYWYGNEQPEDHKNVVIKVIHAWPGEQTFESHPLSQMWSESVSSLATQTEEACRPHIRQIRNGLVDSCLPPGLQPNSQITACCVCKRNLNHGPSLSEPIHHCRVCGLGVCDECSMRTVLLPGSSDMQRACDICFEDSKKEDFKPKEVIAHDQGAYQIYKITEKTAGLLGSIAKTPFSLMKRATQPSYWQPDSECIACRLCKKAFHNYWLPLHHCRTCGYGVCDSCSQNRDRVPLRAIDHPVRICDKCYDDKLYLLPSVE